MNKYLPDIHPIVVFLIIGFNSGLGAIVSIFIRALFKSAFLRQKAITAVEDGDGTPNSKDATFVILNFWGCVVVWLLINILLLALNELIYGRSVMGWLAYIGTVITFAFGLLGIKAIFNSNHNVKN